VVAVSVGGGVSVGSRGAGVSDGGLACHWAARVCPSAAPACRSRYGRVCRQGRFCARRRWRIRRRGFHWKGGANNRRNRSPAGPSASAVNEPAAALWRRLAKARIARAMISHWSTRSATVSAARDAGSHPRHTTPSRRIEWRVCQEMHDHPVSYIVMRDDIPVHAHDVESEQKRGRERAGDAPPAGGRNLSTSYQEEGRQRDDHGEQVTA